MPIHSKPYKPRSVRLRNQSSEAAPFPAFLRRPCLTQNLQLSPLPTSSPGHSGLNQFKGHTNCLLMLKCHNLHFRTGLGLIRNREVTKQAHKAEVLPLPPVAPSSPLPFLFLPFFHPSILSLDSRFRQRPTSPLSPVGERVRRSLSPTHPRIPPLSSSHTAGSRSETRSRRPDSSRLSPEFDRVLVIRPSHSA